MKNYQRYSILSISLAALSLLLIWAAFVSFSNGLSEYTIIGWINNLQPSLAINENVAPTASDTPLSEHTLVKVVSSASLVLAVIGLGVAAKILRQGSKKVSTAIAVLMNLTGIVFAVRFLSATY
jgi:hypothetical protein